MRKKILVTHTLPKQPFSVLENDYEVIWPEAMSFSREEILDILPDCEVVVAVYGKSFDKEMIEAGSNLKLIANYGAGVDNIDVSVATQKGIVVTNTPDAVTEPTAELTMGLLVDVARRISEFDKGLRENKIHDWGVLDNLSTTLQGKTLGIIGMGAIGQALARRAYAFGMDIIYHNRNRLNQQTESLYDAKYTDLESLLRHADFVSLNVPLTPETRKMIGVSELKSMKSTAYLINTARGQVLDQEALISALKNREIAGAALDVYDNEPHIPEAFFHFPNVVLVPHVGSATHETREIMSKRVAGIIQDFFLEMRGLPVVNSEVWKSPNLRI
ncbi:MAG: NAD(P)-dependent oxidoreductase [Bacteroidota bacterium]